MRTTGIRLIAETGLFKRKMRESKDDVKGLGDELGKVGDSKDLDEQAKHAETLRKRIKETEAAVGALAQKFAAAGGDDSGITKELQKQQSLLRELKSVERLLPSPADMVKAGSTLGTRMSEGLTKVLPGGMSTAMTVGGVAAAPMLGATIAAAVVGGAAAGGIIGGALLAAKDPRVKAAGSALGASMLADLQSRAAGFVQPVLNSIERVKAGFQAMGPDLDRVFKSSRFVEPLVDGALTGARRFVKGFADAVGAADPVMESLRTLIASVGGSVGDVFSLMAQDAKQGASAVEDLTMAVVNLITVTGGIIHASAQVKGFSDSVDEVIDRSRYWIEDNNALNDGLGRLGLRLDLTADGFAAGSKQAEAYRAATLGTATAADFATLKQAGMTDAQIASADASGKYRVELDRVRASAGGLMATEESVTAQQKVLTQAQKDYTASFDRLNPRLSNAAALSDGLRTASQKLYGAQMAAADANQAYEASWDSLSAAVKENGHTLNVHTAAGRSNRDALKGLISSTNDLYFADIAAGMSIAAATKKHQARIAAVKEEAHRVGLNKNATNDLIGTYGRIPKKKTTDLVLSGLAAIAKALKDLYVFQRALADGIPIASEIAKLNEKGGPAKRYGGYAEGGWTGPGHKHQPAGVVHADEYVIQKSSRQKIERRQPGLLDEMNATGQVPGYAGGGPVAPVDTSGRWPFRATLSHTKVPTRAQAASRVVIPFGSWPSSPSAQRGDSGVWHRIVSLIKSTGPLSGSFGNGYRAGDPLWHGSGRAVDWMGYNQDRLASFLAARRPLELIHRTNSRDYAYTRGRNKGSFNESLMNAHRNHIHIAMANGGTIREPIVGVGRSGATYSFGENGVTERVIPTGRGGGGGGGGTVIHLNVSLAAGANPREAGRQIAGQLGSYLSGGGSVIVRGSKVL